MPVARFLPSAWIDDGEAQMIVQVLGTLHRRANRRWPAAPVALVRRALVGLEGALGVAGGPRGDVAGSVGLGKEELLDLAGDLLDASGMLHRGGCHVDAMALEGVEARLLEAIVGAGAIESPG
ncbi:MAG TPA: hypothetical protein VGP46_13275 [Acidimicrobiales bacterium]|nr:hypothetical protein [Acidimicrobiales bacterium]